MKEVVEKVIKIHSLAFKRKVVKEYLGGDLTQKQIMQRYGLKSRSMLPRWIRELGCSNAKGKDVKKPKFEFITYSGMPSRATCDGNEDPKELQKKIAELQHQLANEKLRSEAFQRMVEKAEKELNIPIRKKSSTK
jgi:transposase-like protein